MPAMAGLNCPDKTPGPLRVPPVGAVVNTTGAELLHSKDPGAVTEAVRPPPTMIYPVLLTE